MAKVVLFPFRGSEHVLPRSNFLFVRLCFKPEPQISLFWALSIQICHSDLVAFISLSLPIFGFLIQSSRPSKEPFFHLPLLPSLPQPSILFSMLLWKKEKAFCLINDCEQKSMCVCVCVYPSDILARLSEAQMSHGALSGKVSWSKEDLFYLTK